MLDSIQLNMLKAVFVSHPGVKPFFKVSYLSKSIAEILKDGHEILAIVDNGIQQLLQPFLANVTGWYQIIL